RARRVDAADPGPGGVGRRIAALLGDVDVAEVVDGDAAGAVEVGRGGRAAIAGRIARRDGRLGVGRRRGGVGVAGDRGDRPAGVDLADQVVAAVGDVEVPGLVEGHALGGVELGVDRPAAVTAVALRLRVPGHDGDRHRVGVEVEHADHVVAAVGHVELVAGRHEHRLGELEPRTLRWAGVGLGRAGRRLGVAGAGDRGDRPAAVDLAGPLVVAVGDVDVALGVDGDAVGLVEHRLGGRAAVAVGAGRGGAVLQRAAGVGRAAPGERRDDPAAVDLADALVEGVGDVDGPVGGEADGPGVVELGRGGRAAVARVAELLVVLHVPGHGLDVARLAGRGGRLGRGEDADTGADGHEAGERGDEPPAGRHRPPPLLRL